LKARRRAFGGDFWAENSIPFLKALDALL